MAAFAVTLFFLLTSAVVCGNAMSIYIYAQLIQRDGVTTTGSVIEKTINSYSGHAPDYKVTYTFNANGKTMTNVAFVGRKTYNSLDLQGPIEIVFAQSYPTVSFVKTGRTPDKDVPLAITFACIWVLFTGTICYFSLVPASNKQY